MSNASIGYNRNGNLVIILDYNVGVVWTQTRIDDIIFFANEEKDSLGRKLDLVFRLPF